MNDPEILTIDLSSDSEEQVQSSLSLKLSHTSGVHLQQRNLDNVAIPCKDVTWDKINQHNKIILSTSSGDNSDSNQSALACKSDESHTKDKLQQSDKVTSSSDKKSGHAWDMPYYSDGPNLHQTSTPPQAGPSHQNDDNVNDSESRIPSVHNFRDIWMLKLDDFKDQACLTCIRKISSGEEHCMAGHFFCQKCFRDFVIDDIVKKRQGHVNCRAYKCSAPFTKEIVEKVVKQTVTEIYKRYFVRKKKPAFPISEAQKKEIASQNFILRSVLYTIPDADPHHVLRLIPLFENKTTTNVVAAICSQLKKEMKNGTRNDEQGTLQGNEDILHLLGMSSGEHSTRKIFNVHKKDRHKFRYKSYKSALIHKSRVHTLSASALKLPKHLQNNYNTSDLVKKNKAKSSVENKQETRKVHTSGKACIQPGASLPSYTALSNVEESEQIEAKDTSNSLQVNKRTCTEASNNEHKKPKLSPSTSTDDTFTVDDISSKDDEVLAIPGPSGISTSSQDNNSGDDNYECQCCYNEVPFDYLVQCNDGHLFCCECLKKYTEECVFGQGQAELKCMTDGCLASFAQSQLKRALPEELVKKYEERVEEESLNLAGLENFVRCPHCKYGAVLGDEQQFFQCQHSSCLKVTCRHCKVNKADHEGLRCNDIETKNDTVLRTSYEEKMANAKIRECPSCKAKFTKESGCNKIRCRCGKSMCYICRVPIVDYSHFCQHRREPKKPCNKCTACFLWSNAEEDDERAIAEIQEEAKKACNKEGSGEKLIGAPDFGKNEADKVKLQTRYPHYLDMGRILAERAEVLAQFPLQPEVVLTRIPSHPATQLAAPQVALPQVNAPFRPHPTPATSQVTVNVASHHPSTSQANVANVYLLSDRKRIHPQASQNHITVGRTSIAGTDIGSLRYKIVTINPAKVSCATQQVNINQNILTNLPDVNVPVCLNSNHPSNNNTNTYAQAPSAAASSVRSVQSYQSDNNGSHSSLQRKNLAFQQVLNSISQFQIGQPTGQNSQSVTQHISSIPSASTTVYNSSASTSQKENCYVQPKIQPSLIPCPPNLSSSTSTSTNTQAPIVTFPLNEAQFFDQEDSDPFDFSFPNLHASEPKQETVNSAFTNSASGHLKTETDNRTQERLEEIDPFHSHLTLPEFYPPEGNDTYAFVPPSSHSVQSRDHFANASTSVPRQLSNTHNFHQTTNNLGNSSTSDQQQTSESPVCAVNIIVSPSHSFHSQRKDSNIS